MNSRASEDREILDGSGRLTYHLSSSCRCFHQPQRAHVPGGDDPNRNLHHRRHELHRSWSEDSALLGCRSAAQRNRGSDLSTGRAREAPGGIRRPAQGTAHVIIITIVIIIFHHHRHCYHHHHHHRHHHSSSSSSFKSLSSLSSSARMSSSSVRIARM